MMADRQPILLGFSESIENTYGYVSPYPDRRITDQLIVESNMVLAPQYIIDDGKVEITGWGLIPVSNAVRQKDA